jgi:hypothetical protein
MAVLVHRSPRQVAAAPVNRWDPTPEVEQLQDRLGH